MRTHSWVLHIAISMIGYSPIQALGASTSDFVIGKVVDRNGHPMSDAIVGTSLVLSDQIPKVQIGYGQLGISVDKDGTFKIRRDLIYSGGIAATAPNGLTGVVLIGGSSDRSVTIVVKPSTIYQLRVVSLARRKVSSISLDVKLSNSVIGYVVPTIGINKLQLPDGKLTGNLTSDCCLPETIMFGETLGTPLVARLRPTTWVSRIGRAAPPIMTTETIPQPGGKPQSGTKWQVIDFWATWCRPCIVDLGKFATIFRENTYVQKHVQFLALHTPDGPTFRAIQTQYQDIVKKFWNGRSLPFTLAFDSTGKTIEKWGIQAYPTTLLISPSGKLVGTVTPETLVGMISDRTSKTPPR